MDDTGAEAWTPHELFEALDLRSGPTARRATVAIVVDCAELLLKRPGIVVALHGDDRPAASIAVARRWLAGEASEAEVRAAASAAIAACEEAPRPDAWAACVAAACATRCIKLEDGVGPLGSDFMDCAPPISEAELNALHARQLEIVRDHAARYGRLRGHMVATAHLSPLAVRLLRLLLRSPGTGYHAETLAREVETEAAHGALDELRAAGLVGGDPWVGVLPAAARRANRIGTGA